MVWRNETGIEFMAPSVSRVTYLEGRRKKKVKKKNSMQQENVKLIVSDILEIAEDTYRKEK